MTTSTWRDAIIEALNKLYSYDDSTHGIGHVVETEELAVQLVMRSQWAHDEFSIIALRAAALLHDLGYTQAHPSWSSGKVEHVRESIRLARGILKSIHPFCEDETMVQTACYLILHHDDTNYSFPINQGSTGVVTLPEQYAPLFDWSHLSASEGTMRSELLGILREADGLLCTGSTGFNRTRRYSRTRALNQFSVGNPLNAWMWEESVIGNVRLAAKRALIDASSNEGRLSAIEKYKEVEREVANICGSEGIVYENSPSLEFLGVDMIGRSQDRCVLRKYESWTRLEDMVRNVRLRGDLSLFPYKKARIESILMPIKDIAPLARYALDTTIERHKRFHGALFGNYALDIFDLAGFVEFELDDQLIGIAPPIVERYTERQGDVTGDTWALVDGLHRCIAAQQLGLSQVRVLVISNVPSCFPLVPFPLLWNEVSVVTKVPASVEYKRKFRFQDATELDTLFDTYAEVYSGSPRPQTPTEAKYYTYRDFSELGSSGIR